MSGKIKALTLLLLSTAPTVHARDFCTREPDLYCSLFTQMTDSGILLIGRWNPDPGQKEVIIGIYAQLKSDDLMVQVLRPGGESFREQLEHFSPELRNQLESEYPEPMRIRIHGPLESHFNYSGKTIDKQGCPALTELYEKLRSVPLLPADGKEWWSVEWWRGPFLFVKAPTSGQVSLRVPPQHPFARSVDPILTRLEQCAA